jgi:CheY-like chemotaxis protein
MARCLTATNLVPRTFEQIAAAQPNLLIVDLTIRQPAAWDLLERVRIETDMRDLPIIIASTGPSLLERVRSEPQRYRHNHDLPKPLDIDDLIDRIRKLIGAA